MVLVKEKDTRTVSVILERDTALAELSRLIDDLDGSGGRVVLVRGEAGIGKSALVSAFLSNSERRTHTLLGSCDDLLTPQPLGPIWDVARLEPTLSEPLADGDLRTVMEATLDLLSRSLRPTVLVLEDTQWADEATLDLITFLGRRIRRANGILVLTYRDGEVDTEHPLRQVVGELPPQSLVRISLERLSPQAVAAMIAEEPFDLEEVLALTDGNPLFVTEVVASGTTSVPSSVQDSVLARVSKLSPEVRNTLDVVSVIPGEVEHSLLNKILAPNKPDLSDAARRGLLNVEADTVSFRHELQRRAVEASLTPSGRRTINQRVVDALGNSGDPSRLVQHAREANDLDTLVSAAPRAARTAASIGSTREAVAHFRTLEPHLDRLPEVEQAALLHDWAIEEFYLDSPRSVDLFERAIHLRRSVGDERDLANTLMFASRVNREHANPTQARAYATEAVTILEPHGPTPELARALGERALLDWIYKEEDAEILERVDQAMVIAQVVDDDESVMRLLSIKGNLIYSHGDSDGMALMEESRFRAERAGDHWGEAAALMNMAGMSGDVRDVERAVDFAQRLRETAARYEISNIEMFGQAMLSEYLLWKGDWEAAEEAATGVLGSNPTTETLGWRVLATIQSRRGRAEARVAILRMWELAQLADGLTILDPTAAILAEYMWLSGERNPDWVSQLNALLERGRQQGVPWPSGAFAFWMWKLGLLNAVPPGTADFYGWIIEGDYPQAAAFWRDRAIPYEEGLALMHGDEGEQIEAVRIFEDLGAAATANKVRQTLAENGVNVPRGRSRATRDHAAGLTTRQAEVLDLLAEGLTNTEIADRLFVSQRTVENHVSAVLMRLDVPDRESAVEVGRAQGILTTP
ncbi:MAG: AAA family ATPase [Acidimicrobiia bacterium]|nr:MAG: AAA family ATPase [Acidimicrobiia bacterium]